MKGLVLAALSLSCVLLNASETFACLCKAESVSRKIARLRKESAAIFMGTVKDVSKDVTLSRSIAYKVTLEVEQSWKGAESKEVTIYTEGGCMVWFEVGRSYLVYAAKDSSGNLRTDVCMRTGLTKYSSEDFERLGKPKNMNKRAVAATSSSRCTTASNKKNKEGRQR